MTGQIDSPTYQELLRVFARIGLLSFGGPAGLTPEMVRRMNEALVRGMQNKDTLERFHNIGAIVHTSSAEEFSAFVRSEHARWGEVIRSAGIKLD